MEFREGVRFADTGNFVLDLGQEPMVQTVGIGWLLPIRHRQQVG